VNQARVSGKRAGGRARRIFSLARAESITHLQGNARAASWVCLAIAMMPAVAAAEPELVAERVVVVGRVGDGPWTDAPTEARADQKAELAAVVIGHRGRRRTVLAPEGVAKVSIGGHTMATESFGEARVQWSTVEPHGFRKQRATNGATSEFYSNVSTEPKTFGRWLAFDHIDYFERVVAPWGGRRRSPPGSAPARTVRSSCRALAPCGSRSRSS